MALREDAYRVGPSARIADYLLPQSDPRYSSGTKGEIDSLVDIPHEVLAEFREIRQRGKRLQANQAPFVAILLSPRTLLPAVVTVWEVLLIIHDFAAFRPYNAGVYDGPGADLGVVPTSCLRQHAVPGRTHYTKADAGFGPLLYYAGAICAPIVSESGCIYSPEDDRTADASRAWANFHRLGLAKRRATHYSKSKSAVQIDTLSAESVFERSGLVVWTQPDRFETAFTPPAPDVLAHMNPHETPADWFAAIFEQCARNSGHAAWYLDGLRHCLPQTITGTPMEAGLEAAHIAVDGSPRANGPPRVIPSSVWRAQAQTWAGRRV